MFDVHFFKTSPGRQTSPGTLKSQATGLKRQPVDLTDTTGRPACPVHFTDTTGQSACRITYCAVDPIKSFPTLDRLLTPTIISSI